MFCDTRWYITTIVNRVVNRVVTRKPISDFQVLKVMICSKSPRASSNASCGTFPHGCGEALRFRKSNDFGKYAKMYFVSVLCTKLIAIVFFAFDGADVIGSPITSPVRSLNTLDERTIMG